MIEINQLANALDDAIELLLPEGDCRGGLLYVRHRGETRPRLQREHSNPIADGLRRGLNDHERAKWLAVWPEVGGQNQAHGAATSNPVVGGCHVKRARDLQMSAPDDIFGNPRFKLCVEQRGERAANQILLFEGERRSRVGVCIGDAAIDGDA
ncbi:MAG: hypothetical protein WCA85_07950 [Paraburkholderia sp.]